MEKERLLELAGVQLNEQIADPALRKVLGDLLIHLNKAHGEVNKAKQKVEISGKLEDALYQLTRELDKAIGEN